MKLVKKWLFPILTCLIVMGAAVLPPYISQLRDEGQFGQIHAEELAADVLPVQEPLDLLERLKLYARWYTNSEIIPSFQIPEMDVDLATQTLEHLAQAGVIPRYLLRDSVEQAYANCILLWNPTDSMGNQTPIKFWRVKVYLGDRSLSMDLDGESGLPLYLNLYDPNMAQWLKYKDPETLPNLAECYFDLLEIEADPEQEDISSDSVPWERQFLIERTDICYRVAFNATVLTIALNQNGTISYDGVGP